jgi:lauroyl/myristoyl acyltransferase
MKLLEAVKNEAQKKVVIYALMHLGNECQGYADITNELMELLAHPSRNEGGDPVKIKEREKFLTRLLCEETDSIQKIIRDIKRATGINPK